MIKGSLNFAFAFSAAVALVCGTSGCSDVSSRAPHEYSDWLRDELCIKEVVLLSSILNEPGLLSSCLDESDCDRREHYSEDGYFQTWHVYADQASKLDLGEEKKEFDSLMDLVLATSHSEDQIQEELVAKNDDRSKNDVRARLSGALQANQNYLLRVSGFGYKETGCYTVDAAAVNELPAPPPTGSIEVVVSSTGGAPAEYTLTLGAKEKSVASSGKATYDDIVQGEYDLELGGINDCIVTEENPQSVSVSADQTETASFEVECPCKPDTPDGTSCDGGAGRCQSSVCVQSPPVISNPNLQNRDVNGCADFPDYTTYEFSVTYSDPDGDVTPDGTRVRLWSEDDLGFVNPPYELPGEFGTVDVSGDGFSGTVVAKFCILFRAGQYLVTSMLVRDAAGNASGTLVKTAWRPPGAN